MLAGVLKDLSIEEIEKMVALLNFHTDASYKTILEQFTSHGKIDVRVAPYLFPLLSDEPLLGLAPSEDSQAMQM